MYARFGPAGTPESFAQKGYKAMARMPDYLKEFGLTAFEYQCGHGLKVNAQTIAQLGRGCREADIAVSLHAPYYISLSSPEAEKRDNSVRYLLEASRICDALGGTRVVVHSGSAGKMSRAAALELAADTLRRAQQALDEQGLRHIHLCPETMGKVNQLGTLEETLELCRAEERFLPTIDFGHLNARTFGGIQTQADYAAILDLVADKLGTERARMFHAHFSKIQYTVPGGEKAHLTFADRDYGPEWEPLMELLARRGLTPVVICESAGTQAEDARAMQERYRLLAGSAAGALNTTKEESL